MGEGPHEGFGFVLGWAVVLALAVSVLGFAVPADGQASDVASHGEDQLSVKYVTNDLVVDLCKWEPMSCPRCLIEPWYCYGEPEIQPTVVSGEITRAEANSDWTNGSIAGSATWSGCAVSGCSLRPFVTIGPGSEPSDCSAEDRHWPHSDSQITLAWEDREYFGGNSAVFDVPDIPLTGTPGQLACLSLLETYEERASCEPGLICLQYIVVRQNYKVLASKLLSVAKRGKSLTLAKSGAGSVKSKPKGIACGNACTTAVAQYYKDTSVVLTAKAPTGGALEGWEGCDSSTNAGLEGTCTVAMDEARNVKATFKPAAQPLVNPQTLILTKAGSGTGTVKGMGLICEAACIATEVAYFGGVTEPKPKAAATVTLAAVPMLGSEFAGWEGCDSEPEGKCVVSMDEAREVTAKFE